MVGVRRVLNVSVRGIWSTVRSPVGKVRCEPRDCQCFCQVGVLLHLRFEGILFPGSSEALCWCRRSTTLSAGVSMGIVVGEREIILNLRREFF